MSESPYDSVGFSIAVGKFFAIAYRNGIADACKHDDEYLCSELAEKLKHPAYFATLDYLDIDWIEWQFMAVRWTREDSCRKLVLPLLMSMRSPKHKMAFVLQLFKLFYRKGILDYLDCHEWLTYDMVDAMPKYPYLLKKKKCVRSSKRLERFEALQYVALTLIKINDNFDFSYAEQEEYHTSKIYLQRFIERVWLAMQKKEWYDDFD